MKKRRVVVAMSGGVDSSVAAALLRRGGHDVSGVSLRVFDPGACREGDGRSCCSARDIRDARRAAADLDIPFSSWDVRREFEERVILPFVEEYGRGRTPNPCVLCNSRVKFGLLLEKARELGADAVATGHYARITADGGGAALERGLDEAKDQSYFLFEISPRRLPEIVFPLGGMTKGQVRERAREFGLAVSEKQESQEICFVPGNDYGAFLAERLPGEALTPGPIVDAGGRRLGTHRGLARYTVGQRRGLGLGGGDPRYVIRLLRRTNTLVVGDEANLERRVFDVGKVNWLAGAAGEFRARVKIRSRHRAAPATLRRLGEEGCRVEFDRPQRAVTPGQAAVFYDGDRVLGGGWIADDEAR